MALTDPKLAKQCADTLGVIAEPARMQVIDLLRSGPKNVTAIAKALKVVLATASYHLKLMRLAGLVESREDGRSVFYRLSPTFTDGRDGLRIDLGWCTVAVRP